LRALPAWHVPWVTGVAGRPLRPAASGAARSGRRSNLDEARGAEVALECQRLAEALSPHDGEARGIDERVGPLIVASKPGPRVALGRILDMHDGEPGGRLDGFEEGDCRRVPVATAQERPRLADDVVRRQDRQAGRPQPDGDAMVGITPEPPLTESPQGRSSIRTVRAAQ